MKSPTSRRSILSACLLLASAVSASAADETYSLRGPGPSKGQIISLSSKTNYKNAVRTIKSGDRSFEDRFSEVTMKEKETEVLAVENGVATRLRVKVIKDVSEESRAKGKRIVRSTKPNYLDGQFLYGELVKGEWKYSLEDVTPTAEQKRALKEYQPFRAEDELLPKEKVKVGHAWKLGSEHFQKILGNQLSDIKAKGSAKFLRVEKESDDEVAVIEFEFELTGNSAEGTLKMTMTMSGKHTIHRSLKTGYDVKGTGLGKMSVKGIGDMEGQKFEVEFVAEVADEETSKIRPAR